MPKLLRLAAALALAASFAGCSSFALFDGVTTGTVVPVASAANGGEVYLFRGVGGEAMSRELDRLADKINSIGIKAEVANFTDWEAKAAPFIARYRNDPKRPALILIGHSAGGDACLRFAARLKDEGIPVSLLVAFDPTRRAPELPDNVERFVNFYQSTNVFGGGYITPARDFRGHFVSVNLKRYWEVLHVNLVKMKPLQDAVMGKIVQVTMLPAHVSGRPIPIEYVVPRNGKIEVWDSGMRVVAKEGDTLKSLAAQYSVPVWVIAQLSEVAEDSPLKPGQELVVPRYIEALPPEPLVAEFPPQIVTEKEARALAPVEQGSRE